MSAQISHEAYLSTLTKTTWNDHLITSEGDIVKKGYWIGRACSCHTAKGSYSISKAQDAVMAKVVAYMEEVKQQGDEWATRSAIASAAVANLNALVDHVHSKRPTSKLGKLEADIGKLTTPIVVTAFEVLSDKVEEIDSSSQDADKKPAEAAIEVEVVIPKDTVAQPSIEESVDTKKRKTRDDETIKEAGAFIKQFNRTLRAKTTVAE